MRRGHKYSKRILAIARRDGWRCHYCNTLLGEDDEEPTVDHFIPWSEGGANALWNLVLSCKECNQDKGNMTGWEYKKLVNSN